MLADKITELKGDITLLINKSNKATANDDETLSNAVDSLISGYGCKKGVPGACNQFGKKQNVVMGVPELIETVAIEEEI